LPVRPSPAWILVADEQHAARPAQRLGLLEEPGRRDDDAGLALDGLDEERGRVRRDGGLERGGVAVGDDDEPRRERAEAVAVLLVGGEADDRRGAPVEVVGAHDDLRLVPRMPLTV